MAVVVTAIAGVAIGRRVALEEIYQFIDSILGAGTSENLPTLVTNSLNPRAGLFATLIGFALLLFGASNLFFNLQRALDTIWDAHPKNEKRLVNFLWLRLVAMGWVLANGFIFIMIFLMFTLLSAFTQYLKAPDMAGVNTAQMVSKTVSELLLFFIIAWLYKVLPNTRVHWRDVWLPAAVVMAVVNVFNWLVGYYFRLSGIATIYGAAGSLVMMLWWVYYSVQIFLFGAAMSRRYAERFGSRKEASPLA